MIKISKKRKENGDIERRRTICFKDLINQN